MPIMTNNPCETATRTGSATSRSSRRCKSKGRRARFSVDAENLNT